MGRKTALEIDQEWVHLISQAKKMGLSKEEIKKFLIEAKTKKYYFYF